jgi:hypothetical protein
MALASEHFNVKGSRHARSGLELFFTGRLAQGQQEVGRPDQLRHRWTEDAMECKSESGLAGFNVAPRFLGMKP